MNDDSTKKKNFSFYIHIPFCRKKCNYCDFVSWIPSPSEADDYVSLLKKEITLWEEIISPSFVKTIYIGGGTPSFFGAKRLVEVLKQWIEKVDDLKEFSVEVNPESLTKDFLSEIKALGVSRISIGIQTFSDHLLNILGRVHSSRDAINALNLLETHSFLVSADIIIGIPGQKVKDVERDLKILVSYPVSHISVYLLELEEGTPLTSMIKERKLKLPSEKEEEEMFLLTHEFLQRKGMSHYEISNYSIPGFECKHNLSYWKGDYYIGAGVSAASYLPFDPLNNREGKVRLKNVASINKYALKLQENAIPVEEKEEIKGSVEIYEKFMLALRTRTGLPISEIKKIFGRKTEKLLKALQKEGLISDRISLKIPCEKWLLYNSLVSKTFRIIDEFMTASQ